MRKFKILLIIFYLQKNLSALSQGSSDMNFFSDWKNQEILIREWSIGHKNQLIMKKTFKTLIIDGDTLKSEKNKYLFDNEQIYLNNLFVNHVIDSLNIDTTIAKISDELILKTLLKNGDFEIYNSRVIIEVYFNSQMEVDFVSILSPDPNEKILKYYKMIVQLLNSTNGCWEKENNQIQIGFMRRFVF